LDSQANAVAALRLLNLTSDSPASVKDATVQRLLWKHEEEAAGLLRRQLSTPEGRRTRAIDYAPLSLEADNSSGHKEGMYVCDFSLGSGSGSGGGGGTCGESFTNLRGSEGLYYHRITIHSGALPLFCPLLFCKHRAPFLSWTAFREHVKKCPGARCGKVGCMDWHHNQCTKPTEDELDAMGMSHA
jgi:hypothetical protein